MQKKINVRKTSAKNTYVKNSPATVAHNSCLLKVLRLRHAGKMVNKVRH